MSMQSRFYESPPCIYRHVDAVLTDRAAYCRTLEDMMDKDIIDSLSNPTKARIVATLHIVKEHQLLESLLPFCDATVLSKALHILDLTRQIRQVQRRINAIEQVHPHLLMDTLNTTTTSSLKNKKEETMLVRRRSQRRKKTGVTTPKERRVRIGKIHVLRRQLLELQSQQCDQQQLYSGSEDTKSSAVKEMIASASVSGSLARKVRHWAKTNHSSDFLEFVMLSNMPTDSWKSLANVVHFAPTDFHVDYFLAVIHGAEPPKDSFVASMRELESSSSTTTNDAEMIAQKFSAIMEQFPQTCLAYMYLRTMPRIAQNSVVAETLAERMPLNTAIWYLEELAQASKRVVTIVSNRVKMESLQHQTEESSSFTKVTNSYGKLLERILTFQSRGWESLARDLIPLADVRLSYLKEKWYTPPQGGSGITVVFGDASSSMTTAIRAATILGTMIATTWNGELSFFSHELVKSPHKHPRSVLETLEICNKIQASGCTSLAAALWPYYTEKKEVDRIVLVTDEYENTVFNGYMFAPLLKQYKEDVYRGVKLILITVGSGFNVFRQSLAENDIEYRHVEIDGERPDLTKFDALLGSIDARTTKIQTTKNKDPNQDDFVIV